jgi:hypothetical protein
MRSKWEPVKVWTDVELRGVSRATVVFLCWLQGGQNLLAGHTQQSSCTTVVALVGSTALSNEVELVCCATTHC